MGEAVNIRMYRDEDMPAVLELLRAALGESPLLQRTPEMFRWKHVDNPFGRSVIFVAEAGATIVGVRAFMRWQLDHGGSTFQCGRAVDTATHPSYLRQGIFRRLTLEALDAARDVGLDLIFNTPNELSRPGYLKMGWSDVGPIRVLVRPHPTRLFHRRYESFPSLRSTAPMAIPMESDWPPATAIDGHHYDAMARPGLRTPRTNDYLRWRFAAHPTARYGAVVAPSGVAMLRANLRNGRSELIVSDALGPDPTEAVRATVSSSKADYEIAAFPSRSPGRHAARRAGMISVPMVAALRLVAHPLDALDIDVLNPKTWRLALSDVELL